MDNGCSDNGCSDNGCSDNGYDDNGYHGGDIGDRYYNRYDDDDKFSIWAFLIIIGALIFCMI